MSTSRLRLRPTYMLYGGDGRGLRGHWVYLIIDCQIKGLFLSGVLSDTHINLSSLREGRARAPCPPPLPFSHPPLHPSPFPLHPIIRPSIYLSIGPDHLSLSLSPSVALSHQHHFSWQANSCLTVMALKAEPGANRCVCVCVCLCMCASIRWPCLHCRQQQLFHSRIDGKVLVYT